VNKAITISWKGKKEKEKKRSYLLSLILGQQQYFVELGTENHTSN
jgi:hypothetical protein